LRDGRLCASSEFIAYVGDHTLKEYGCGDHAHIFGNVIVEFTDNGISLTDLGVVGT